MLCLEGLTTTKKRKRKKYAQIINYGQSKFQVKTKQLSGNKSQLTEMFPQLELITLPVPLDKTKCSFLAGISHPVLDLMIPTSSKYQITILLGPNLQIKMRQEILKTPNQKLEPQNPEPITLVLFINQRKEPEKYMFLEVTEVLTTQEKPLMIYTSLISRLLNGLNLNQAVTQQYYQILEEDIVQV